MKIFTRLTALAVLLLAMAAASGCGNGGDADALRLEVDERLPLQFGVFPFLERGELEKALAPLTGYLATKLGREVRINVVADYIDLERLVRQRRIDVGWFSPRSREAGAQGVMIPLCRPRTTTGRYHGLIVARRGSGAERLDDLASGSFAYVDRHSKSGFLYPNRVFAERGIDPLRFFSRIHWAGNHEKCIQGVLDGRWTAAAVTSLVVTNGPASVAERLVVLATSPAILTDPIVFRDGAAGLDAGALRSLLTKMGADPAGQAALSSLSITLGIHGFDVLTGDER